jgi:hypothetical protein
MRHEQSTDELDRNAGGKHGVMPIAVNDRIVCGKAGDLTAARLIQLRPTL